MKQTQVNRNINFVHNKQLFIKQIKASYFRNYKNLELNLSSDNITNPQVPCRTDIPTVPRTSSVSNTRSVDPDAVLHTVNPPHVSQSSNEGSISLIESNLSNGYEATYTKT